MSSAELPGDAFALLNKPTLDLSEADVVSICETLRKRRQAFLAGRADKPAAKRKAALDDSAEAKAARTEHLKQDLLDGLDL